MEFVFITYKQFQLFLSLLFIVFISYAESSSLKFQSRESSDDKILACYYRAYNIEESLLPSNVCTHIIFAFGVLTPKGIVPGNVNDTVAYRALVKLKEKNPKLKVMISLQKGFPEVVNLETDGMLKFALSAVTFLNKYNMDGLDLDWEFPFLIQKSSFSEFITILGDVLHWSGKYLSLALPNDIDLFERGYFVDTLNAHADFMTVMTYDFHFYSKSHKVTGFNSPLYSSKGDDPFRSTAGYLDYLLFRGVLPSKMLLGFPTYARTWQLANASIHGLHAPAVGLGAPGPVTNTTGYYMIQDVCYAVKKGAKMYIDRSAGGEYMVNGKTWIAFNGMYSAGIKTDWLKRKNLAGVGVWTFEDDDPHNLCRLGAFPILTKIRSLL